MSSRSRGLEHWLSLSTQRNSVVLHQRTCSSSTGQVLPDRVAIFEAEATRQSAARLAKESSSLTPTRVVGPELPPSGLTMPPGWRPLDVLKAAPPRAGSNGDATIVGARLNGAVVGLADVVAAGKSVANGDAHESTLEWIRFDDEDGAGAAIYWHSAAHVVGAAVESVLGRHRALLTDGPPLPRSPEGGFFYEMRLLPLGDRSAVTAGGLLDEVRPRLTEVALQAVEAEARLIAAAKHPFVRLAVPRAVAEAAFADNPYKLASLVAVPLDKEVYLYRTGNFIDLCAGPHLPSTSLLRPAALALTRTAGADGPAGELLQRAYGIAFPSVAGLTEWRSRIAVARARDHRVIGRNQSLWFFHDASPGSVFLLPHGTRLFNALVNMLRTDYRRRGYEEVMTPLLYRPELWETSGHLAAYGENMYGVAPGVEGWASSSGAPPAAVDAATAAKSCQGVHRHGHHAHAASGAAAESTSEESHTCSGHSERTDQLGHAADRPDVFGLKPMNCPGHCLVYAQRGVVSFRDLPLRFADFSPLHRNEPSGGLGGLTRLRRFTQDDAHIFCTEAQVATEVAGALAFVTDVYARFGFGFRAVLSTRPERHVGDAETWARAEAALHSALASAPALCARDGSGGSSVTVDVGGGAFYGPKIDIFVRDAIGREHQCATVQLDFQLPRRFGLLYDAGGDAAAEETSTSAESHSPGEAASNGNTNATASVHNVGSASAPPAPAVGVPHVRRTATPVMIHRAILGSVERMMAVLAEHTGGKWPFWLSPRQVQVVPIADRHAEAAVAAVDALRFVPRSGGAVVDTSLHIELDASSRSVGKRVREAQLAGFNIIAVIGDREAGERSLTLRFRDNGAWVAFQKAAATVGGRMSDAVAAAAMGSVASDAKVGADAASSSQPQPSLPHVPNVLIDDFREVCEEMRRRFL